jgi:MoaA/NifB/PqqE/SkfB family radical SAM enzyme
MGRIATLATRPVRGLAVHLARERHVRRAIYSSIGHRAFKLMIERNPARRPHGVHDEAYTYLIAMIAAFDRAVERSLISKYVARRMTDAFWGNVMLSKENKEEIVERLGFFPPKFVLVSPTGRCNLRCKGCYAESEPGTQGSLDFETFDRILTEKRELWGSHFTVISGGEPFMWRDGERDFLDMVEKHDSDMFMVYTNATLINDAAAKRMSELGNIMPAISVEGFEKETDARRGKGVHRKVLAAMESLRKYGVPFGISATPTRHNWELITGDAFADFYFEQQGALYAWLFQYMPVGRGQTLELAPTPEQRVEMRERMRRLMVEKKYFIADFWNSGAASSGCIAAGRGDGYFYIDWNGNITPCAFVPYVCGNIYDVFESGGDLNTVLKMDFFKRIRKWQDEYGYAQAAAQVDNWLCPCVIRDHFPVVREAIEKSGATPLNEEARIALSDTAYCEGMVKYGEEIKRLTDPIWQKEYADTPEEGAKGNQ